jgi:hypothetical protein
MLGHDEPVRSDNSWQRTARRLQSMWREGRGLPAGLHNGTPLGSRLTPEDGAPPRLAGYLSDAARAQVQAAVADSPSTGALLSRPRLWVDLLSSQPLCFNAFGNMAEDLDLATAVMAKLLPDAFNEVTGVRFEYSPGRSDARYTGSRSAFDVFVEGVGPRGRGFVGVEVKYHESMQVAAAVDRGYAELARSTEAFLNDAIPALLRPPLQQLLLDHLLALRLQQADADQWDWGAFALLYPRGNDACAAVADSYASALAAPTTFRVITLEEMYGALAEACQEPWVAELRQRYLGCP